MAEKSISDEHFIELFRTNGIEGIARITGVGSRNIAKRRRNLEKKYKIVLKSPNPHKGPQTFQSRDDVHGRINKVITDGVVIIGSDAHIYPGEPPTALRAFKKFVHELKPKLVILNGDVLDAISISRHPPVGWFQAPSLADEIDACKAQLYDIEQASKNSEFLWPLGNHDARFSVRLATVAPEYAKVHGTRLRDHFPRWQPCWSVHINPGEDSWTEILHNWKNGIHSSHNNAKDASVHYVTGHDHAARISPFTNRRGTWYGVNTGTLANIDGDQFEYVADRPKNWRSGFGILTYRNGRLMHPELVLVIDELKGLVEYRTEIISV